MRAVNLMTRSIIHAVACAALSVFIGTAAQAVTVLNFNWEGQIAGFGVRGDFSYDEKKVPTDGVIRKADLLSFNVSFYDPQNKLLRTYADNHLTYSGFNFNYDTRTKNILQDGRFSTKNGIDIGEYVKTGQNSAKGLNFWSGPYHVHFDDWANEFKYPRGFGGHEDISFFRFTTKRIVDSGRVGPAYANNPNFPLDAVGRRMTVVPLPATLALMAGGLALTGAVARRRG